MDADPIWLQRTVLEAVHRRQLIEHGGLPGLWAPEALESSLARVEHRRSYEPESDLPSLAAAYGYGLVINHPFNDGNKRLGFLAMFIFLGLNGYDLEATEEEVVDLMRKAASGRLREEEMAEWVRLRAQPSPRS